MAVRGKFCLAVLLLSVLFLCAGLTLATRDPELTQCKHQCQHQRQYDEDQKAKCMDRCEKYYKEKKEHESEVKGRGEEEEGRRSYDNDDWVDLEKRPESCESQCERLRGQGRALCGLRCRKSYGRYHGREEEEVGGVDNPYVFEEHHFTSRVKSEHGRIDVLQKFTKEAKFLRGIENYRVAILEANPQTFVAPSHWDADAVLFVAKGRGTITTIREEKKESFNIECGDVIRVHAGTPVYLINRDENEKLFIVNFVRPVNLPGKFEAFRAPGGEDQSFYSAFSWELLEAAFKTDRRRLEHILKQSQDFIAKASKEQIQSMSHHEKAGRIWPFGEESSGSFNLLHKRPVQSNNYGQLFEVDHNDYEQLKDLELIVSVANITRGSMIGPYYNSKATKVSVVLDGEGYFEMACPHVSDSSQQESTGSIYQKVSSRLRQGTVFVVPAGHPVASVASEKNNLVILCFEVNSKGNTRYPLAGKNNVVNKMERAAKELAFGVKAREVEQVFGNQDEELFFPGPRQHQREGRACA
ncbi:LOW QUALITY PROTEIN: vicilin Cor a 11.0101-like [Hevea brasiliensis]|uniref:LOW QUALITY PROTEIN: vicilin Cor a 11.0101-like n=1 Tax=Hevea brasiliensis TaxID=3981 RepID=UPI0025DD7CF0|nr:LOW QUALITY PROTEIN: vicilin Cor a 11.0101-like [Hevea brasiliensis]